MYTSRFLFFFILLSFCSPLVAHASAENLGGYTVSPVPQGMDPGTPFETKEASFWELPIQVILLSLALSISPLLELITQLVLFTKFYLYLGYRKLAGKTLFHNNTREQIYQCIQENPGIFFNAIIRKTGVKPGTLRYHLIILRTNTKISILESEGNARYFENSGRYSDREMIVLKFIQNSTDRRILLSLMNDPELNRKELGNELGISGLMVTWYMKRLSDAGIISLEKSGKNARYEITPDARNYLEKYLVMQ
jgi:predicted transcriptional regulator